MTLKVLHGSPVAKQIHQKLLSDVEELKHSGIEPRLAIFRVGNAKSSLAYEYSATKYFQDLGIIIRHYHYPETISEEDFLIDLKIIGKIDQIHGILVLQPLPAHISLEKVAESVPPSKDVDGMHPYNLGRMLRGSDQALTPTTAKAVMSLIDFYQIPIAHQNICIIGKSNAVGKPLTILLLNRQGTVSNCHTYTKDISAYTKEADVIVCAAGVKHLVTADMVKDGVTIIDIGYNVENGRVYGDADFEGIGNKAKAMTPVPGGVGAVTTATLAEQVLLVTR